MDAAGLSERLRAFAKARDWEQFHNPKNLVMALSAEVGELTEIFQWRTAVESQTLSADDLRRVSEEIADIQIYLVRLTDALGVGLEQAVAEKIEVNETKYPVEKARGSSKKYTEL